MNFKKLIALSFFAATTLVTAQNDPVLLLSKTDAQNISSHLKEYKILEKSFDKIRKTADKALKNKIEVPLPADNGGGYTHEKHKRNYREMYAAGVAYRVTGEKAYAKFVENMLLQYAKMYPGLPLHPQRKKTQNAGKLFWQGLNDCVWLVHGIQAYDLVKADISAANREIIERDVFRSMAAFLSESEGGKDTFNKIHNHGTWAVAGVGMTGYVLKDKDMVDRALYGSAKDGKSGFIKQIELLFSPDGYYSEGPYYQRYALQPFMVFAQAININQPEIKIFEFKDRVLGKAVKTVFQLTDGNGYFFPFNDSLKEKNFLSEELVFAADIAYQYYNDASLLPVIKEQGQVVMAGAGFAAAQAVQNLSKEAKYIKESAIISDGADGKSGGVALLRADTSKKGEQLTLVYKFASQGMGHGHFDRLGILLYNNDKEILQDYGAARFLNVESKSGGRYLDENHSYAQQSVAHNTVVVDETSHYGAEWKKGEEHSPQLIFSDIAKPEAIQIVSAVEENAYPDTNMQRTVAVVGGDVPFVIDVYSLQSKQKHKYDLNFMYSGHIMETDFEYTPFTSSLSVLGSANGYQHLWKLAEGKGNNGISKFTWLNDSRFYTISTVTDTDTQLVFTKAGANDPKFNLRAESGYMVRVNSKDNYTFVSVIEPHGSFDPKLESVQDPHSKITAIKLLHNDKNYTALSVTFKNNKEYILMFANKPAKANTAHTLTLGGKKYSWNGNYKLLIN
ncbi:alginate lyase family protein [Flavobacterium sp. MK4S-17]|uniref:alginate lyase family protein n=1 Tax=Flavobacterium sp. MK4S-17 TaxID=2543737 RepID=UPI00135A5B41|nr:alginate lyase family protein [Flavobacterium sp. MK4S-17]